MKMGGIFFGLSFHVVARICRLVIAVTTLRYGRPGERDSCPDEGKCCFIFSLSQTALASTQSLIRWLRGAFLLGKGNGAWIKPLTPYNV